MGLQSPRSAMRGNCDDELVGFPGACRSLKSPERHLSASKSRWCRLRATAYSRHPQASPVLSRWRQELQQMADARRTSGFGRNRIREERVDHFVLLVFVLLKEAEELAKPCGDTNGYKLGVGEHSRISRANRANDMFHSPVVRPEDNAGTRRSSRSKPCGISFAGLVAIDKARDRRMHVGELGIGIDDASIFSGDDPDFMSECRKVRIGVCLGKVCDTREQAQPAGVGLALRGQEPLRGA